MSRRGELSTEKKYRMMLSISNKISGTLDLETMLTQLLDMLQEFIDYNAGGIFILNREEFLPGLVRSQGLIAGMAARGFDSRPPENDPMLTMGKGIIGHVIRTGESYIASDVQKDPNYIAGREKTQSEIAIPIFLNLKIIGALNLESDQRNAFSEDSLETLRFFADVAGLSLEKVILHRLLLEKKVMEDQLGIARAVQSRLLPKDSPKIPGYDIAGFSIPTYQIGGDYFDFIHLSGGRLGLVVADVSGKGIPAALIMATFRAALRSCIRRNSLLKNLIDSVNTILQESTSRKEFVTAVYGVLDIASGSFSYVNCGHIPPLLLGPKMESRELKAGGFPLGIFKEISLQSGEITLDPGDLLVLYSDGVVEIEGDSGEEFGRVRLAETILRSRGDSAEDIIKKTVEATRDFSGVDGFLDDFTLMVIRRFPL